MNSLLLFFAAAALELRVAESRSNCYSCASTNMKSNFITKQRGPPNRKQEPLAYDNHCDEDPWIIKQRATVICETKCFKWQQTLNNSGSYSKMTFRGCYDRMFDLMNPTTQPIPDHNFCTMGEGHVHETKNWFKFGQGGQWRKLFGGSNSDQVIHGIIIAKNGTDDSEWMQGWMRRSDGRLNSGVNLILAEGSYMAQLACLSDASVIEHSCWCNGDFCNGISGLVVMASLLTIVLAHLF